MKIIGLIGNPLGHSFSRKYFTNKFYDLKLFDYVYSNFQIENITLINDILKNNTQLIGFNVTIPYKQEIIEYLDFLDESAEVTGSVNCVKVSNSPSGKKLTGFNTDIFGFETSLRSIIKSHHKNALILGNGGSAKSVRYVLNKLGISYLTVSRNKSPEVLAYDQLTPEIITNSKLIVNTTPLGMYPKINYSPDINYRFLTPEHLLFDLIYNPQETAFLRKGKASGAETKNGMEMLHLQADRSLEIFLMSDN